MTRSKQAGVEKQPRQREEQCKGPEAGTNLGVLQEQTISKAGRPIRALEVEGNETSRR